LPPRAIIVSDWLLLKKSSPLKLLGQIKPNLAGSIYVRSSIKLLHLVPFGQQTWPPRAILFSDWLMLKKSSPLKLLGQMEPNLAGSIHVTPPKLIIAFESKTAQYEGLHKGQKI